MSFNADHADTDEYYESDSETSGEEDVSQSHWTQRSNENLTNKNKKLPNMFDFFLKKLV